MSDQLLKDVISELRAIRALLERGRVQPPEQAPRTSAWTAGMVPVPTCRAEALLSDLRQWTEEANAEARRKRVRMLEAARSAIAAEIFSLTASEATERASAAASAASSAEAVELKGLRAEVRACVSALWSIEKVLTRFDQDGLPPARAMG